MGSFAEPLRSGGEHVDEQGDGGVGTEASAVDLERQAAQAVALEGREPSGVPAVEAVHPLVVAGPQLHQSLALSRSKLRQRRSQAQPAVSRAEVGVGQTLIAHPEEEPMHGFAHRRLEVARMTLDRRDDGGVDQVVVPVGHFERERVEGTRRAAAAGERGLGVEVGMPPGAPGGFGDPEQFSRALPPAAAHQP